MSSIQQFLATSYTAYHAVANGIDLLRGAGFCPLSMGDKWSLLPHHGYYVAVDDSTLVAFKVGDLSHYAWHIATSHTDSPCLKVKGDALLGAEGARRLNVEVYGGPLLYSFLDIPLRVAGRVYCRQGNTLSRRLVVSPDTFHIPSLCIHHNPDANRALALNPQVDMLPWVGDAVGAYSLVCADEVVDADLLVVPDVAPTQCGVGGDLLVSPRIDNLVNVYSSLHALIASQPKGVAVACCLDSEEIGSGTVNGAQSSVLKDVLYRINAALGRTQSDMDAAIAHGLLLSIDNGQALHPAHPEKSDPAQRALVGKGIVIKHHTNYCSNGHSSAIIKSILDGAGLAHQDYYNRSDLRCGSTLGLMAARQLGIRAVDIGLAQWAMHSAVETCSLADIDAMTQGIRAFFDCTIQSQADSDIID